MNIISILGLALGSAWTSGINLYATVAMLGLFQKLGLAKLPGGLESLDNWVVIGVAAFLYIIEFIADKVPYVDTVWDVVHTFIRVPAGAIVAYAATTQMSPSVHIIATLLGGGLALSSHGTKATVRAAFNLSPEPFTNWTLSIIEDVIAFTGVILAMMAPIFMFVVALLFLLFAVWILPKTVRRLRRMFGSVRSWMSGAGQTEAPRK